MEKCSECNQNKKIVNKFFKLCIMCNKKRLSKNKKEDKLDFKINAPKKKTTDEKILEDEIFYEKCFDKSDHKCEECKKPLPNQFRNSLGKIIARYRYSHIVPKSIAPKLRHNIKNINHLCLTCHAKWENGDKKSMQIYKTNLKRFPNHF